MATLRTSSGGSGVRKRCGTIETRLLEGIGALLAAKAPIFGTAMSRPSHRGKGKEKKANGKARKAREDGGKKREREGVGSSR